MTKVTLQTLATHPHSQLVAAAAYAVDRSVRSDLCDKKVVDERDYVSNLTAGIRKIWATHGLPNHAHSQTLDKLKENVFGCDAMILLRRENQAKVCLFEAKLPKLDSPRLSWDSIQKSSKISHFSDQLRRQSKWVEQAAIWESFIHEWPPGEKRKGFDAWGSTCFWHEDTYSFDKISRDPAKTWKSSDLLALSTSVSRRGRNLRTMLLSAAQCRQGSYLRIDNGRVSLASSDGDQIIEVPASFETVADGIEEFVERLHLRNFLYLSLTRE